jgi:hypothetical protein
MAEQSGASRDDGAARSPTVPAAGTLYAEP